MKSAAEWNLTDAAWDDEVLQASRALRVLDRIITDEQRSEVAVALGTTPEQVREVWARATKRALLAEANAEYYDPPATLEQSKENGSDYTLVGREAWIVVDHPDRSRAGYDLVISKNEEGFSIGVWPMHEADTREGPVEPLRAYRHEFLDLEDQYE